MGSERIEQTLELMNSRYDFRGKSGIVLAERPVPGLPGDLHGSGDVPRCDFCIWLTGFAEEAGADRDTAEAKLAEVSYRCGTLFFSAPGLGRAASELVLRHTRYEHALDIGIVNGHGVFMCW